MANIKRWYVLTPCSVCNKGKRYMELSICRQCYIRSKIRWENDKKYHREQA